MGRDFESLNFLVVFETAKEVEVGVGCVEVNAGKEKDDGEKRPRDSQSRHILQLSMRGEINQ